MHEEQTAGLAPRQWRGLTVLGVIGAVVFASLSVSFIVWFASESEDAVRLVFGVAFGIPAVASAYIAFRSAARS